MAFNAVCEYKKYFENVCWTECMCVCIFLDFLFFFERRQFWKYFWLLEIFQPKYF